MAPRSTWKGHLRLSLVSCPVRLFNAVSRSEKISFNLLHKDTHNRIQMKPHDPELGAVERDDLVKGYQYQKDQYVVFTDEDFDKVQIESSKAIVIEKFVDAKDVDPMYFESPYYVAPDGAVAEETFRVIQSAMREKRKVALSRVVLSNRERLIALMCRDKGLLMMTLRTADEVRDSKEYFTDIEDAEPEPEMLELAEKLIEQKSGKFDPSEFQDRYQDAVIEMVKAKVKGQEPVIAQAPERGKVINLMDALRRSLGDEKPRPRASRASPPPNRRRPPPNRRKNARRNQPEGLGPCRPRRQDRERDRPVRGGAGSSGRGRGGAPRRHRAPRPAAKRGGRRGRPAQPDAARRWPARRQARPGRSDRRALPERERVAPSAQSAAGGANGRHRRDPPRRSAGAGRSRSGVGAHPDALRRHPAVRRRVQLQGPDRGARGRPAARRRSGARRDRAQRRTAGAGRARRRGPPLARLKLVRDERGRLARRIGDAYAELDGQIRLSLPRADNPSVDEVFDAAEEAEQAGDLAAAATLYRRCVSMDPHDPIAPFNLANVLREQGGPGRPSCSSSSRSRAILSSPTPGTTSRC